MPSTSKGCSTMEDAIYLVQVARDSARCVVGHAALLAYATGCWWIVEFDGVNQYLNRFIAVLKEHQLSFQGPFSKYAVERRLGLCSVQRWSATSTFNAQADMRASLLRPSLKSSPYIYIGSLCSLMLVRGMLVEAAHMRSNV